MAKRNCGPRGPRRQGGWIGAAISLGTAIFGSKKAKSQEKQANAQLAASDPYGKYRDAAAQKLNALVADPSQITGTAEYKARQTAASRLLASQGYTGSGNAVAAAAEAGGQSYQQAFENLSTLAGAGAQPGGSNQALANAAGARDTSASAYAGIGNNLTNLVSAIFNKGG